MANENQNVVYVEFFHANMSPAIRELFADLFARHEGGRPFKTALRFFDERGQVTKLIESYGNYEAAHEHSITREDGTTSVTVDPLQYARKQAAFYGQARSLIVGQVGAILKGSKELAIEVAPSLFRTATEAEQVVLLEHARKADHFWLYLLKPAGLLSTGEPVLIGKLALPFP